MTDLKVPVVSKRDIPNPAPRNAAGSSSAIANAQTASYTAVNQPKDDKDTSGETPAGRKTFGLRHGPLTEQSDKDLVLRSIKGDAEAYGELVNRYQLEVRNLARAIVKDFQNAEDLAQDAFIKAYHSLSDLKEPEKFGGWICTILRHTALDFLRSGKRSVSLETLQEEGFEPAHETPPTGHALLESHEEEARTLNALVNLREDYREIIILKHVEKLSYKDIAKRLNMSVSAVGEKLSRVRALLKRRLEKQPVKSKDGEK
jgi:RNA polymerase sigma-70 factor (ECF subfamily)